MATTAIFAEVLIAGLEALAWLSLLVVDVFGTDWAASIHLKGWEALTTIVAIAAAYVLGVLVDRFADSAHGGLERLWTPKAVDKPRGVGEMRLHILGSGGPLAAFFEYQRSRLRIARATALNATLATPVVVWFLLARTDAATAIGVGAAVVLAAVLSELAYRRIKVAYVTGLSGAYRLFGPDRPAAATDTARAAAIPYRRDEAGAGVFLLVGTRGGKERWTFPKGRFEAGKDETLADTGRREAREEAGVEGRLDDRALDYPYPGSDGADQRVVAFLLEVAEEGLRRKGGDAKREIAWCTREDAVAKLAENRDPGYADEMEALFTRVGRLLGET